MDYIKNLVERKPQLKNIEPDVRKAYDILIVIKKVTKF